MLRNIPVAKNSIDSATHKETLALDLERHLTLILRYNTLVISEAAEAKGRILSGSRRDGSLKTAIAITTFSSISWEIMQIYARKKILSVGVKITAYSIVAYTIL